MPYLGAKSRRKLKQVHPKLVAVIEDAIELYDFTVVWGYRGKASQDKAFREGNSKKRWPNSKHNGLPSLAVDLAPWPEVYEAKIEDFCFMAGIVCACAFKQGVKLRWGGDFNQNQRAEDGWDWGHFELLYTRRVWP